MNLKGRLSPDHTAYIEVEIVESGVSWEVIVDTGFSGFLCLPEDLVIDWRLPFLTTVSVVQADQSISVADVYTATINWLDKKLRVEVLAGASGSDALIGMQLLEGSRIELDQEKGEVRVEPLRANSRH